jgi:phosphinothricin acetyltransferase
MALTARPASLDDAESITRIYNDGIRDRVGTFETDERTPADVRAWFDGTHPIVVVVEEDGSVVAFASTSRYLPRECYAGIAEFSVYVDRQVRGRGAGRVAMEALVAAARDGGYWKLTSRVFVENVASRTLLKKLGFREVGVHEKHARLDGIWRDVVVVERLIAENQLEASSGR